MAAKLLHSLADENPDLQRQIGCMTGIFQLFDRHHILTGKRINQKRLPPANSHSSNGGLERQSNNIHHQQTVTEINLNKGVNEKQRLSMESSRASFSSSCSSSISSLECSKTNQQEASFDRIIFPETPSRDPVMNQSITSPQLGRQSLDLRDVVKDSMYREARGLAVKTTNKEETAGRIVKHRDSPRPLQLSKPTDGSNGVGVSMKKNMPADLKESLRALAKLREAPWYYNECRDNSGSLYEVNDGSWHTIPKDAPRFSYDGREINHLSFETRDTFRSTPRLKELPRLSLDSRECSMRSSNSDSKRAHPSRNVQNSGYSNEKAPNLQQSFGTQKRPPSVVAKLMGLEALPDSALANDGQFDMIKISPVKDVDPFQKSSKINYLNRPIQISNSRNSIKEPISPRWKNPDLVMKPVSSSRFPIEPAPWRMQDGSCSSQRPNSRPVKVPARATNTIPSVYSEIEKRLKDLEFKQSGKDLRALKQILEAMQVKGLLETRKEEQNLNFGTQGEYESGCISPNLNVRSRSRRNQQSNHNNASIVGGSDSLRTFESPIVIMKPAKLVEKASIPSSSVIPMDGISDLCKPQNARNIDGRKGSTNSRAPKDQSSKYSCRDSATSSVEKRASSRNIRSTQSSSRSHQLSKEDTPANVSKSTGSVSPRLQQKKLEMEKRSRPPTPPSDSNRARRQSGKQPTDLVSPGGKARPKCANLQQCDDELSEISNDLRALSCQGDEISVQSDSNILLETKIDMEVTSAARSTEIDDIQSSSMKADEFLASDTMQNKSAARLDEEESFAELDTVGPEHPSPVSVLDNSAYRDDAPSPVKQISNVLKGDDSAQDSNDCQSADNPFSDSIGSGLTSEINRKKLQNIENLVQKLRRLNSSHDEARTDYIASLCENTNPDHRYISEILLASGLLLRDLGSGLTTFQLHPSGHPINPELFFVLEQTKASSLAKEECSPGKVKEKVHRKLIFDAVNDILVGKLALVGVSFEPWLKPEKLAKKTLNAQKLLKELCSEIEQFETKRLGSTLEVEEDGLKNIFWEDVMHKSGSWTDFHGEIPGIVLHVEKLIFKDLVDEIVIGEAANLRTKPGRRRQLFAK